MRETWRGTGREWAWGGIPLWGGKGKTRLAPRWLEELSRRLATGGQADSPPHKSVAAAVINR